MSCAVLIALGNGPTLLDRFLTARSTLDLVLPRSRRVGRTYQGFIKALIRCGDPLVRQIATHLRVTIKSMAAQRWQRFGWVIFAVDGSKINAVRSAANESAFGVSGKNNSGPQQLLTTLWHMGTGLPWAWVTSGIHGNERDHLRAMIDELPVGSLLVADAGFTGYDLLRQLNRAGLFVLIRAGGHVNLLRKLGFTVQQQDDIVYLWPARAQARKQPPLVLRLIEVRPTKGKRPVVLLTSVFDHERLTDSTAAMIYQMRWGVEVFYRSVKQTLQRRKMRSAAPRQTALELQWTMIGIMMLGVMTVSAILKRGHDPLSWSVAAASRVVRRTMGPPAITLRTLWIRLASAVKDSSPRKASKKARCWPHRKTSQPPGAPVIRDATPAEVQLARLLTAQLIGT